MTEISCAVPQQTIYGYNIQHLALIAMILQKEGLPPERVAEALTDMSKIVDIISDEFEESLRKSVSECFLDYRFRLSSLK